MSNRVLTIGATLAASLFIVASAGAATGQLSFAGCLQGPSATGACPVLNLVDHPTDLNETGILGVTSATSNTAGVIQGTLAPAGCYDNGGSGCIYHTGQAIEDPEGLASVSQTQAYVAGDAHDSIAELFGVDPRTARCIAQDGALGCDVAHGLHHPTRMVLTPDATQLYAATADGVAWFNVDKATSVPFLTFAGCRAGNGAAGCDPAVVGNEDAIAISPDGASVYVGSTDGTLTTLHRGAGGALTPIASASGLPGVNALAISPDGASLYAASTAGGALSTFARAADGTPTRTGCLATAATPGCGTDTDLSSVDSVTVSPEGANVYAGDTQADAITFARAGDGTLTAAGCRSATGGPCAPAATVTNPSGAIVVSRDGQRVWVASVDHDGLAQFTRERAVADLRIAIARRHVTAQTAQLLVTVTNDGPFPAKGVGFLLKTIAPITLDSARSALGDCMGELVPPDPEDSPVRACPMPDLAVGASTTATVTYDSGVVSGRPIARWFFGTATVIANPTEIAYLADPGADVGANTTVTFTRPRLGLWGAHASHRGRRGATRIAFTLSRAASVTVSIRAPHGHATLHRHGHRGLNVIRLPSRIGGRRPTGGHYRATVSATATGFARSASRRVGFTVFSGGSSV